VLASAVMGGVLWFSALWLNAFILMPGWRWIALLVLISIGSLTYFGVGQLIGAFRLGELKGALRRG